MMGRRRTSEAFKGKFGWLARCHLGPGFNSAPRRLDVARGEIHIWRATRRAGFGHGLAPDSGNPAASEVKPSK